jgi:zinc/manganese transport system substrate-binding protein
MLCSNRYRYVVSLKMKRSIIHLHTEDPVQEVFMFPLRQASCRLIFPLLLLLVFVLSACGNSTATGTVTPSTGEPSKLINVVAAENFYGDIVKQLGGSHVSVTNILSDPNVDPHEYESNVQTAITISKADFVIENSGGYDDWMDKILSGSPNSNRLLLKGFDVATTHLPENEHVWYSFTNAAVIAQAIVNDLKQLDPADTLTFDSNLQAFQQSLQPLSQKVAEIKSKYNGTPVGLIETIYLYQAQLEGLNVLTPFEFEKAIAEGNDPPADTVITATNQINNHQIKILIYNEQTITPVTTNLENLARAKNILVVPVTETMPPGKTYQTWMMNQLNVLETALGG